MLQITISFPKGQLIIIVYLCGLVDWINESESFLSILKHWACFKFTFLEPFLLCLPTVHLPQFVSSYSSFLFYIYFWFVFFAEHSLAHTPCWLSCFFPHLFPCCFVTLAFCLSDFLILHLSSCLFLSSFFFSKCIKSFHRLGNQTQTKSGYAPCHHFIIYLYSF